MASTFCITHFTSFRKPGFLRRIRQTLLEEGQLRKYSVYALGWDSAQGKVVGAAERLLLTINHLVDFRKRRPPGSMVGDKRIVALEESGHEMYEFLALQVNNLNQDPCV